jgi:hypothetical protein
MAWGAAWPRHLRQGQNQTTPSNVGVFLGSSDNKICKSVNLLKHEFDRQYVSLKVARPVPLSLSAKSCSHSAVFFSYNKSATNTFSHGLSAKRMEPAVDLYKDAFNLLLPPRLFLELNNSWVSTYTYVYTTIYMHEMKLRYHIQLDVIALCHIHNKTNSTARSLHRKTTISTSWSE